MQNNFDSNTMNNIKNLVEKGDISQAISQISPEMLENFSKMMNNSQNDGNYTKKQNNNYYQNSTYTKSNINNNYNNTNTTNNKTNNYSNNSYNKSSYSNNSSNSNGNTSSNFNNWGNFDFNNIDVNTIMKIKSIMENMNNKNDASHNLLYSLKPYLRESKQEKIDQYANLLNISKIADAFNNNHQN